ncbi:UNVERIFIED_CONTAM: hypothetical protein PYX00_008231 [Menopon gallinae]|uniref:Cleavage and polyadenylation specificity factor subunit 4 n=1 Tax=Menopon gallinae TaxID=328185 RepID=A0AAW2HMF1_9NEOP
MELIVASVEGVKFDIETALEEQYGALPLPFPGMDKSIAAVCTFYPKGTCLKGAACPFRHIRGDRTIVCKHWLRGLCKKGDQCEFLHEYDMSKMPECYFYSRFNACHNKECPFLHIDPESKIRDCPWYDRGFCRHGPHCRHRHVRRVLCMNYLAGFCPDGPECKFMHPRFELPAPTDNTNQNTNKVKAVLVCHYCNEYGHKAMYCLKMTPEQRAEQARIENEPFFKKFTMQTKIGKMYMSQIIAQTRNVDGANGDKKGGIFRGPHKPLDEVTCYKCGLKGHYANRCPKGHLAFLSKAQQNPSSFSNNSENQSNNAN